MNPRLDHLRAHVWRAVREVEANGSVSRDTVERLINSYVEWPARRVDIAAALELLRESTPIVEEAAVLRELRMVAVEICVMCQAPHCKGGPDCTFRMRINSGVSERVAKWRRGVEWRELIEAREARRVA